MAAEDPETVRQYRALALAISDATTSLADVFTYQRQLNSTADEAAVSVDAAERALERVQEAVDNAQMILDDDGRRLLAEAMAEQREAGQQSEQLTEMAHEARQTAERYVLWSGRVKYISLSNIFLTTREAAWYISLVVWVCLSVCQTITLESLDLGSSYLYIRYIFREYGSGSYMKVIGSRSRSQEQKRSKILIPAM